MLIGRAAECATLDASLSAVRDGRSEALVLLGEPGVGKSALLTYTAEAAADLEIVRVAGVEAEMELPFAALHQLCLPLLDHLEQLPAPQADAIATTFGLRGGAAPGPFLVGLGVLNLLAEAAQQRPVLCVVDDAQWLDAASAQVVAFVARRLRAESVLMVIATRQLLDTLSGLTELVVRGLPDGDARQLLSSVVRWPLDDGVRTAILAEARGNPLALLELPLGSPGALAGGFGLLDAPVLASRVEESFRNRVDDLPADSQLLLLVAAADPVGDPVLMWRAADALGLSRGAGRAVEASGLLTIGVRVVFRHPLVRSAVYRAAPQADRRRVHRALAEMTSREVDPDRRAWHLAHATSQEDEVVATELEASAGRAQARGGLSAAAAFLERAAAMTADPARRADRELAAARNKYQAGLPDEARSLLDRAEAGPSDDLRSAQVRQLRGHLAFAAGHGADAPALLLDTARRFERFDSVRARETYLDAVTYALLAGRFAGAAAVSEIAAAVRAAPAPVRVGSTSAPDLLLDALAVLYTDGHEAGAPMVRRALAAFGRDELSSAESIRWLSIACHGAYELWDDDAWQALATLHLQHARAAGALVMLPVALNQRITAHLHAGEFAAAVALVEETDAVAEATGIARPTYGAAAVAAWRGQESDALRLIRSAVNIVTLRREGIGLTLIQQANAVLHNGLGRFPEALKAAELATADPAETAFASWRSASWSKRPRAAATEPWRRVPSNDSPAPPVRAIPTGAVARRRGRGPWSVTVQRPRPCTAKRSIGWDGAGERSRWLGHSRSMANGCVRRGVATTPAIRCERPTTSLWPWARRRLPRGPGMSCLQWGTPYRPGPSPRR